MPLRTGQLGGWYHVTARGNGRSPFFRDHQDRAHFGEWLGQMENRFWVWLRNLELMENLDHLMAELAEPNLSRTG